MEKSTIQDIANKFEIIDESISKFGLGKSLLINNPQFAVLFIGNNGVIRASKTYRNIEDLEEVNLSLAANYTLLQPSYKYLKTYSAGDNIFVESSVISTSKDKYICIEISSASYRQERIELYKIEAKKGVKLYQKILSNIGVDY